MDPPPAESIRILHVDDEPGFAEMTSEFLTREDTRFDIETALNAADGLDELESVEYDCIISDFDMPDRNGIEFLEEIRAVQPDLPFILFTGKGSEEIASEAISAGVTDYLQKRRGSDQYAVLANRVLNAVEKYHAQREARQVRNQLEAITENSTDGIITIDASSHVKFANSAVEDLFGYDADAIEGERLTILMPDEYRAQHLEAIDGYLDTGERTIDWSAVEFPGRHKDGHELPLSISFGEFELDGDRRFIGIIRDISDQKRRERDLQQQTERLDQFASMISHDLQNPLSIALHHLELYREEGQESDLDGLEEALHRIKDLTVELTSLARHGDGSDEDEPVSLATIAEEAWGVIDQRDATLETDDATIIGNRVQFGALFENLFRNAVGHGGHDVTIRVGPLDDGFYVEDTGKGILSEDRETVFEHGYSTGYGGSGVGLSLVRRVATANEFVVTLTESDEGGARFEFHRSGS